jgi:hypothetical protein
VADRELKKNKEKKIEPTIMLKLWGMGKLIPLRETKKKGRAVLVTKMRFILDMPNLGCWWSIK